MGNITKLEIYPNEYCIYKEIVTITLYIMSQFSLIYNNILLLDCEFYAFLYMQMQNKIVTGVIEFVSSLNFCKNIKKKYTIPFNKLPMTLKFKYKN